MRLRTPARRPAPPRRAARTAVRVAAVGAVAASAVLATLPAQAEVPPAVTAAPASVVPESVSNAGLGLGLGDPYFPTYGNRGYDVRHYSIDDSYQPGSGALRGRTRLRAVATKRLPKIKLDLVLVPGVVRVDGRPAAFRQRSGRKLVITPRRPIAAGRQFRVKVTYHGTPGQITRGRLSPWVSDAGEGLAVGEPEICAWWFPVNDHPRDKATYDITVRVPRGRQVISNGALVSPAATAALDALALADGRADGDLPGVLRGRPASGWSRAPATGCRSPSRSPSCLDRRTQDRLAAAAAAVPADRRTGWRRQFGPLPVRVDRRRGHALDTGFALENQSRPTYPYLGPGATTRTRSSCTSSPTSGSATRSRSTRLARHLAQRGLRDATRSGCTTRRTAAAGRRAGSRRGTPRARPATRSGGCASATRGRGRVRRTRSTTGARWRWQRWPPHRPRTTLAGVLRTWVAQHRYGNADIAQFEALAERVSGQDLAGFFAAWLYTGARPAATAANGLA